MIAATERIKRLISQKNSWILEILEEGRVKEAIKICHERLSTSEDLEIRLIYSLALYRLGYSILAQEEIRTIENILSKLKEIQGVISAEFRATSQQVPLGMPILEEELPRGELEGETEPVLTDSPIQELKDLSTPSLAELYAEQGAIEEAIKVYERYLELNPEDTKAQRRLGELKGFKKAPEERLINILEAWLMNLRASLST